MKWTEILPMGDYGVDSYDPQGLGLNLFEIIYRIDNKKCEWVGDCTKAYRFSIFNTFRIDINTKDALEPLETLFEGKKVDIDIIRVNKQGEVEAQATFYDVEVTVEDWGEKDTKTLKIKY